MDDRRQDSRIPQFGSARILIEYGKSISCALMDRSDGGAKLKVVSVLGIPDTFLLQIGQERIPARIAWRSPAEIGVAFEAFQA